MSFKKNYLEDIINLAISQFLIIYNKVTFSLQYLFSKKRFTEMCQIAWINP